MLSAGDADRLLPADAPRWPEPDGRVKTSAAWLIEHSGFGKGYGADRGTGTVSLSSKHPLALTNRGGARTEDLLALAREVRDGVRARTGIELVNEPVLVGVSL
jgi:UDP-N-acetylmuramate dehydrogenase